MGKGEIGLGYVVVLEAHEPHIYLQACSIAQCANNWRIKYSDPLIDGGNEFWNSATWAGILKQTRKPKKGDAFANTLNGTCFSCKYSIDVRNVKYGLPYRTYI